MKSEGSGIHIKLTVEDWEPFTSVKCKSIVTVFCFIVIDVQKGSCICGLPVIVSTSGHVSEEKEVLHNADSLGAEKGNLNNVFTIDSLVHCYDARGHE